MQCKSCTPWLASVLCFTNSKTSTASHCILLLPRSRMEIAEKPASRRKKAGFTFSERFGATIGQHPVITFACQANSTHPLPVCCRINHIRSLTVFIWVKHQHVEYGRTDNGPYSCSGGKSTGTKSIHSIFWDHMAWMRKANSNEPHGKKCPLSFVLTGLRIHRWDKWSSYSSTAPDHCKQRQPRSRLHDSKLDCLRVLTAKSWIGVWQDRRIQIFNPFHSPCHV